MTYSIGVAVGVWVGAYLLALIGSGPVVRQLLRWAGAEIPEEEVNPGRVIGKLEDLLVVSLVIVEAYTALALVFSAKGIIRVTSSRDHPSYYILGTLANFTWALHVALLARGVTTWILAI